VWVDDEDEFARHRVELGYPDEVAGLATASRDRIRDLVTRRAAPFDGAARRWFAELFGQSD
jgi:protein associated with RNAse G/E